MAGSSRSVVLATGASIVGSAPAARALSIAIVGTAVLSHAIRALIGWPGLIAIVVLLSALSVTALTVRRSTLEWRGLLTVSLLAFLAWCAVSVFWSDYQWASLAAILYQVSYALLGVSIALLRDPIQVVRTFGDVLRIVLAVSLALEILSGVLIDTPIAFLGVQGDLGSGGPVQGLLGNRNQLGIVALIGLITFAVEALTRSIGAGLAIGSMIGAGLTLLLTMSPVAIGALVVTAIAAAALAGLRRLQPQPRRVAEWVLSGAIVLTLIIGWLGRSAIIAALNAGSEFEYRHARWQQILAFIANSPLEGFGWIGLWRDDLAPYTAFDNREGELPAAFNSYLDVWLQVGLVGLVLFLAMIGLALVRSWLLAANKRSVVYVWPALVLVALIVAAAAESVLLAEFGWLILVICAMRGSEGLSWRSGLREADERPGSAG